MTYAEIIGLIILGFGIAEVANIIGYVAGKPWLDRRMARKAQLHAQASNKPVAQSAVTQATTPPQSVLSSVVAPTQP